MKTEAPVKPAEELRPKLHGMIDQLDVGDLNILHRMLLRLEAERLANRLVEKFSKVENLEERIDAAVKKFRKAHPYR